MQEALGRIRDASSIRAKEATTKQAIRQLHAAFQALLDKVEKGTPWLQARGALTTYIAAARRGTPN